LDFFFLRVVVVLSSAGDAKRPTTAVELARFE
jgi:hypothetical protein